MGVGMNLKNILRNRNMTIKQLSENSGISINTLYSITKRDSERIDEIILQRIAYTLDVPTFELTGIWNELDKRKVTVIGLQKEDGSPVSSNERAQIEAILSKGSKALYDELTVEEKKEFWKIFIDDSIDKLNDEGIQKVANYAQDIARIPKYCRQDAQPPSTTSGENDSTQPQDAAERPQKPEEEG